MSLASEGIEPSLIAHELVSTTAGQREALAIALSYVFRAQALDSQSDPVVLERAARAISLAITLTG